jgi:PTS system cellobiose-specific IIB component
MAITHINDANIVLLGPQVRYELKRFEQAAANKIPVIVIEPKIYGTMNAKALIEQIKGLIV